MHVSVEDSLRQLRTTYIDIFYVHWWDYMTSIEEVMNGLHHLVVQRKVLYLVGTLWVIPRGQLHDILTCHKGHIRYASLDRSQSERVRTLDEPHAVCHIPRRMEYLEPRF